MSEANDPHRQEMCGLPMPPLDSTQLQPGEDDQNEIVDESPGQPITPPDFLEPANVWRSTLDDDDRNADYDWTQVDEGIVYGFPGRPIAPPNFNEPDDVEMLALNDNERDAVDQAPAQQPRPARGHIVFGPDVAPPRSARAPGTAYYRPEQRPSHFPQENHIEAGFLRRPEGIANPNSPRVAGMITPPTQGIERRPTPYPNRDLIDPRHLIMDREQTFRERDNQLLRARFPGIDTHYPPNVPRIFGARQSQGGRFQPRVQQAPYLQPREANLPQPATRTAYGPARVRSQSPINPRGLRAPNYEEYMRQYPQPLRMNPNRQFPPALRPVPRFRETDDHGNHAAADRRAYETALQHNHGRGGFTTNVPRRPDDHAEDLPDAVDEAARPRVAMLANQGRELLYGRIRLNSDRRHMHYEPTNRFVNWLHNAAEGSDPGDGFHTWLRRKEAEDEDKKAAEEDEHQTLVGQHQTALFRQHLPLLAERYGAVANVPDQAIQDLKTQCLRSAQQVVGPGPSVQQAVLQTQQATGEIMEAPVLKSNAAKDAKRRAESPTDERPSKRSRLAESFRRRLSIRSHGTGAATANGSGETGTVATKRVGTLNIFNPRSFSAMRGLSRATSTLLKRVRIAVIGDAAAGKTTVLNRLYTGNYQPAERSTHCRHNDFHMAVDGHQIILEAWDIPGALPADQDHPLRQTFFDVVMICFAIDNVENVETAHLWVSVLQKCLVLDTPLYMVGLKVDARPSYPRLRLPFMNEANPSTREQCESGALAVGAVEYFECSAKTGEGVKDVFDTIIDNVRSMKDDQELKRASRLRRERINRAVGDAGRRISQAFCVAPRGGASLHGGKPPQGDGGGGDAAPGGGDPA